MPAVRFWLIHAALVGGAAVVLLVVRILFGHMLRPGDSFEGDLATDLDKPAAR
ncbi:MAG: hypothetical protein JSS35_00290, partial [Proteobacteria bacterium]|nr:hypothetical protein [Pseudomonadota bacterium]